MYLKPKFVGKLNELLMAALAIDPETIFSPFPCV